MTERAPCVVPGCRGTIRRGDHPAHWNQFICARHWGTIPKAWKRAKARHEREYRKFGFYPREEIKIRIWRRILRRLGV